MFFMLPNIDIVIISVLAAVPFYFWNRYLRQKIRPQESKLRTIIFFLIVLLTAMIYAISGVYLIYGMGYLKS